LLRVLSFSAISGVDSMQRLIALILFVAFSAGSLGAARADDTQTMQLFTRLLIYPNSSTIAETVGRLADGGFTCRSRQVYGSSVLWLPRPTAKSTPKRSSTRRKKAAFPT
jgi:hypothetical protein